jgi:hypothetical protein
MFSKDEKFICFDFASQNITKTFTMSFKYPLNPPENINIIIKNFDDIEVFKSMSKRSSIAEQMINAWFLKFNSNNEKSIHKALDGLSYFVLQNPLQAEEYILPVHFLRVISFLNNLNLIFSALDFIFVLLHNSANYNYIIAKTEIFVHLVTALKVSSELPHIIAVVRTAELIFKIKYDFFIQAVSDGFFSALVSLVNEDNILHIDQVFQTLICVVPFIEKFVEPVFEYINKIKSINALSALGLLTLFLKVYSDVHVPDDLYYYVFDHVFSQQDDISYKAIECLKTMLQSGIIVFEKLIKSNLFDLVFQVD